MRFLTTESGRKCINIDKIEGVSVSKLIHQEKLDETTFVLTVNRNGLYTGSFEDVKIRYINLIAILSYGDTPSVDFISNNFMVVMKNDGTFECEESNLWVPDIHESDFN